jgi:hypothetical protein
MYSGPDGWLITSFGVAQFFATNSPAQSYVKEGLSGVPLE